jgi:hypothetical protein
VLWRAWEEVRQNGGSAGVDGVTIEDIEWEGVEEFLEQIEQDLKAKRFIPCHFCRCSGDRRQTW